MRTALFVKRLQPTPSDGRDAFKAPSKAVEAAEPALAALGLVGSL